MAIFLNVLGLLLIISGVAIFGQSRSAIHEIEGTLALGFGSLLLALGIIARLLTKIEGHLREARNAARQNDVSAGALTAVATALDKQR